MDDFERYTPDTHGLNVTDLNRLIDQVTRNASGYAQSVPSVDTPAGRAQARRPDVLSMMLIQLSAVTTSSALSATGSTVLSGYDWHEVVLLNGVYTAPGDGRSGTALLNGALNFPAFDIRGAADASLNYPSSTSAYLAWLSWDERSLQFIGVPLTTAGGGTSGGSATFLTGARAVSLNPAGCPLTNANNYIIFDSEEYDTNQFHPITAGAPSSFESAKLIVRALPDDAAGYYQIGCNIRVTANPTAITTVGLYLNGQNQLGGDAGNSRRYRLAGGTVVGSGFINFSTDYWLVQSDYVHLQAGSTAGMAAIDVGGTTVLGNFGTDTTDRSTAFWIHRLATAQPPVYASAIYPGLE